MESITPPYLRGGTTTCTIILERAVYTIRPHFITRSDQNVAWKHV